MKTDRELLELAAKAAGYSVDCGFSDCPLIFGEDAGPDGPREWNPLDDDGDALRLAVRLKFDIDCFSTWTIVRRSNSNDICVNGEQPEATRRAIVRAAAEIGESMND